ncbi:Nicotinamide nucleotide repair protein [Hartmannibacter diazotrophicus]|uniref:Bifunctional NAD(P)H-hydrate repair enzyme n=1 Tax=Hartmannibacter diazotrophicus TaxID=1482074 RepID=A0A2C9D6T7_9HYPH|nr:NAD(P)H-hydrate dehydratase [Hartmannibacter diazotrophicus]SON56032.1 Nicotinamide nucleotide repair protein [Hartmannibacter diazotrophicus]
MVLEGEGSIFAAAGPHLLLRPDEMGRADSMTIEKGTSGSTLMENAGLAIADDVVARHRHGTRVTVVCGPGNNGGDGFVAARVLAQRGMVVRLLLLGDTDRLTGDAAIAAKRWRGTIEPVSETAIMAADVVIDAIFGAGLARPVEGRAAEAIGWINAARRGGASVIAVDLPSGIDGRTGEILGIAVEADRSVTFFRRKPGHLLLPGRVNAGRVVVADIGIKPSVLGAIRPMAAANHPDLWKDKWPRKSIAGHKYSGGSAVVACGGVEATGAARLAAGAALRAGAGLVTVTAPGEALPLVAGFLAALITRRCDDPDRFGELVSDPRLTAIVLGPALGVGEATRQMVRLALGTAAAVVLDADALTSFEDDPGALFALVRGRPAGTVMTPHSGEFRRLFKGAGGQGASKLDAARAAAEVSGGVVVFKGADTVIAGPDGFCLVNENAPADLATAGSGDVLAGIIGGLLAQGIGAREAAAMGVYMHGMAGNVAGPGLVADDLVEAIRAVRAAPPFED